MQSAMLRGSAFSGSSLRSSGLRSSTVSRAPVVVVKAVQDVKGIVVSTSMQNTVVVSVERLTPHPKYIKRISKTNRFYAHADEATKPKLGDYVRLEGCRPLSKTKRFKVAEVIRVAQ
ncbi:plastid ribosomal protein S17 [Haematococcus lacustris]